MYDFSKYTTKHNVVREEIWHKYKLSFLQLHRVIGLERVEGKIKK
jgi:hypothetical protein